MFERGYKTWCETYATVIRKELGVESHGSLDSHLLAKHLGIKVITPHDVLGLTSAALAVLLRNDGKTPSCWSAVTLVVAEKVIVILNSSHSAARQASDLTHELAHRIRGHETHEMELSAEGMMFIASYDKVQEEEADWLAGCLLLPRAALIHIKKKRLTIEDAATSYGVSKAMVTYRLARTGVNRQFA